MGADTAEIPRQARSPRRYARRSQTAPGLASFLTDLRHAFPRTSSSASPMCANPSLSVFPVAAHLSGQAGHESSQRPRERLLRLGAAALTDQELLAVMLGTGRKGCPVMTLSEQLIADFRGLRGLLGARAADLLRCKGLGSAKTCHLLAIQEVLRRAAREPLLARDLLQEPGEVRRYCQVALGHLDVEHCIALYLDARLHLIDISELTRGTLSHAAIYPREIVREALQCHASAVILAHNHPSGNAQPSQADQRLTQRVRQALALLDIQLLDHVVVAGEQAQSMAELGMC